MNKLIFALVVALGFAPFSAQTHAPEVNVLEQRIAALNATQEEKATLLTFVTDNKKTVAALATLALAGVVIGGAYLLQDKAECIKTAWTNIKTYGYDKPAEYAKKGYENVTDNAAVTHIAEHKKAYIAASVALPVIAALIWDITRTANKSVVKALIAKLSPKANPAV